MLKFQSALAMGVDAYQVGREVATVAMSRIEPPYTLALVYMTDHFDPREVTRGIREILPEGTRVVGCHVPGVVVNDEVNHNAVALMLATGDELMAATGAGPGVRQDPRGVTERVTAEALDPVRAAGYDFGHSVLLVMPDGISGNSVNVAHALGTALGPTVRVAGGGSGDSLKFQRAEQVADDQVGNDMVVALALGSRGPIGLALRHGCLPSGPPCTVTRSEGAVVYELDWAEAGEAYLGMANQDGEVPDFTAFAMFHPFGIPQGRDTYVLRSPLQVGAEGQIFCCSDVPQDGIVRVMQGDTGSLLDAAREAATVALEGLGGRKPTGALVFSCVSRDFVLGGGADGPSAEIAAIKEIIGQDVPVFGSLMFGQLGSLHGGATQFHSKSMQVCLFCEAA